MYKRNIGPCVFVYTNKRSDINSQYVLSEGVVENIVFVPFILYPWPIPSGVYNVLRNVICNHYMSTCLNEFGIHATSTRLKSWDPAIKDGGWRPYWILGIMHNSLSKHRAGMCDTSTISTRNIYEKRRIHFR